MKKLIALLMTFALVFSMMVVPTLAQTYHSKWYGNVHVQSLIGRERGTHKAIAWTKTSTDINATLKVTLNVDGTRNDGVSDTYTISGQTEGIVTYVYQYAPYSNLDNADSQHTVNSRESGNTFNYYKSLTLY